jgi:transcriptional regulator with XRE-family HTH domain
VSTVEPMTVLPVVAWSNGRMEATERLASLVVARRVELGYKRRPAFAEAAGISLRTLGDLETGRRTNFDPATIAAIEQALRWDTGSIGQILSGGDPSEARATTRERAINGTPTVRPGTSERDEALLKVLASDLPEDKKEQIIRLLIAEKQAADRARAQRAEDLIRIAKPAD